MRYCRGFKEVGGDDYKGAEVWQAEVRNRANGRIEVKVGKSIGRILPLEKDD